MRPIKFRAWIDREMIYPKGDLYIAFFDAPMAVDWAIYNRRTESNFYKHDGSYPELTESNHLMQFTGLMDKNGKEIYEGDIVRFIDDVTIPSKPDEVITEVFWWDVMACFSMKNTYMELNFTTVDEIEVIGNIYQNPELL